MTEPVDPPAWDGHVVDWLHSGGPDDGDATHAMYRGKTALLDPNAVLQSPTSSLRAIAALLASGYRVVVGRRKGDGNG